MYVGAFIVAEYASAFLSLILLGIFLRVYMIRRENFLLGLPLGFALFALSYASLGASQVLGSGDLSSILYEVQLASKTLGYLSIYFSYVFAPSTFKTRMYYLTAIGVSVVTVLLFSSWILVVQPFAGASQSLIIDEFFRIVNLLLINYVIYYLANSLARAGAFTDLIWTPLIFVVLWVSEYSLFIWGIDGSLTAFYGAQIMRIGALLLMIRVYFSAGRGR